MEEFLQETMTRLRVIWRIIQGKSVMYNVHFVSPVRVVMNGGFILNCRITGRPYENGFTVLSEEDAEREVLAACRENYDDPTNDRWVMQPDPSWPLHNDHDLQGKI